MEQVPVKCEVETNYITVDPDTMSMLKEPGMNGLPDITTHSPRRAALREFEKFLSAALLVRDARRNTNGSQPVFCALDARAPSAVSHVLQIIFKITVSCLVAYPIKITVVSCATHQQKFTQQRALWSVTSEVSTSDPSHGGGVPRTTKRKTQHCVAQQGSIGAEPDRVLVGGSTIQSQDTWVRWRYFSEYAVSSHFSFLPRPVLRSCGLPKRTSEGVLVLTLQHDFHETPSTHEGGISSSNLETWIPAPNSQSQPFSR